MRASHKIRSSPHQPSSNTKTHCSLGNPPFGRVPLQSSVGAPGPPALLAGAATPIPNHGAQGGGWAQGGHLTAAPVGLTGEC